MGEVELSRGACARPAARCVSSAHGGLLADVHAALALCQFTTLRLRLIRIGVRIIGDAALIRIHLQTSCPERSVFAAIVAIFASAAPP
jgi:hypothetical protein